VVVDQFGPVLHLQAGAVDGAWVELLAEAFPGRALVQRVRGGAGGVVRRGGFPPPDADDRLGGRAGRIVVIEEGLRFGIDLLHGQNPGLFLDARAVRRWLRSRSRGLRVLNLFAYTGSLGVAALAGGARSIEQVDVVPSALERARGNHQLNGQRIGDRDLVQQDAFAHLEHAARKGRRWDLVILDPPPVTTEGYAPGQRGRQRGFDPERDWAPLLEAAQRCTLPGGRLVVLCANAAADVVERLPGPVDEEIQRDADFPGAAEDGLRAWVVRVPGG
jgi:23S rRNA G2069 N7-methylase RlmK/C1962 C5-methylase RlmI